MTKCPVEYAYTRTRAAHYATGNEEDGRNEVMLPCDFMEEDEGGGKRIILDDDIYKMVVEPLKKGVSLVAVMDCCHSGTLMDLAYTCVLTPQQFRHLEEEMRLHISNAEKNAAERAKELETEPKMPPCAPIRLRGHAPKSGHEVAAHVVMFSGCKDDQESADVSDTSEFGLPKVAGVAGAGGACTNAMLKFLSDDNDNDTWVGHRTATHDDEGGGARL